MRPFLCLDFVLFPTDLRLGWISVNQQTWLIYAFRRSIYGGRILLGLYIFVPRNNIYKPMRMQRAP